MSLALALPVLRVEFESPSSPALADNVLAAVGFGCHPSLPDDPRCLRAGLEPLGPRVAIEVWRSSGTVRHGRDGAIRYADDGYYRFAILEADEQEYGGIEGATQAAYAAIARFQANSTYPALLRIWNYFDAINLGLGDDERYKRFCVGRHAGMAPAPGNDFPAATAIGRHDGIRLLQIYWLAARQPGLALENPRQCSAYRYPRQYGPQPPGFSRAMLHGQNLFISGTASVIGHQTQYPGDVLAQLDETWANLEAVIEQTRLSAPALLQTWRKTGRFKVYLRDPRDQGRVETALRKRLSLDRALILAGDICRAGLQVEIEVAITG